jgi:hypothetical protein
MEENTPEFLKTKPNVQFKSVTKKKMIKKVCRKGLSKVQTGMHEYKKAHTFAPHFIKPQQSLIQTFNEPSPYKNYTFFRNLYLTKSVAKVLCSIYGIHIPNPAALETLPVLGDHKNDPACLR